MLKMQTLILGTNISVIYTHYVRCSKDKFKNKKLILIKNKIKKYRYSSRHISSFSITTERQTTKFSSANFQKMLSPSSVILRIQILEGKQCRSR